MNKIIFAIFISSLFVWFGVVNIYAYTVTAKDDLPFAVGSNLPDDSWVEDKTITIAGKLAARSAHFLDWTFKEHHWACIDNDCNGNNPIGNPFANIFKVVRDIIYAILSLSILFAAFMMIITRGREIKATKFIGKFILAVLLVTLIYSIIVFIYQIVDIVTGFFLKYNGSPISHKDLLNVDFDYQTFKGYKKAGLAFSESAFVSLWLTRLTALTYFVISLILMIRKIILWFFLIVSPLFPLLFLFKPLRGVYKIWLGEFLRWLFYAPLFAVLLAGVVSIWNLYIPVKLTLNCQKSVVPAQNTYPTATVILLGGPCQNVTEINNLNTPDSFIQYVVALLMLWMVIIVPFLLLRMLVEYVSKSFEENNLWRLAIQKGQPIFDRYRPSFLPTKPPGFPFKPTPPDTGAGNTLTLPISHTKEKTFVKDYTNVKDFAGAYVSQSNVASLSKQIGEQMSIPVRQSIGTQSSITGSVSSLSNIGVQTIPITSTAQLKTTEIYSDLLALTDLTIPTIVDISRYETAQAGENQNVEHLNRIIESLNRLTGNSQIITEREKQTYSQIKQKLEKMSQNPMATSILSAAHPASAQTFPNVNQIQTVNLADYEMVKRLWKENYQKAQVPQTEDKTQSKKDWLKAERERVEKAIKLISSEDPKEVELGRKLLSKILPFLLLGGFSKAEIVAYLKAKENAISEVLEDLEKIEGRESLISVEAKKKPEEKHMSLEVDLTNDKTDKVSS